MSVVDIDLEGPYSRDEIVAAVTDYYQFLDKMFLRGTIEAATPGGWSIGASGNRINPPKTDRVKDLARYLPTIHWEDPGNEDAHRIYEGAWEAGHDDEPPDWYTLLPAHVLTFARPLERNGHWIFIDTERATITLCDFMVGPGGRTDLAQVY